MAAITLRIKIPRNPANLIVLAKLILDKHAADGASSVLNAVDMAGFASKTTIADTGHERMGQLRKGQRNRYPAARHGSWNYSGIFARQQCYFFYKNMPRYSQGNL